MTLSEKILKYVTKVLNESPEIIKCVYTDNESKSKYFVSDFSFEYEEGDVLLHYKDILIGVRYFEIDSNCGILKSYEMIYNYIKNKRTHEMKEAKEEAHKFLDDVLQADTR